MKLSEAITDAPSLYLGRKLFFSTGIPNTDKVRGPRITLLCPGFRQDTQGRTGISLPPAEGRVSAESAKASPCMFAVQRLEVGFAPSHTSQKPTGFGIPLALVQVGTNQAST